MKFNEKYGKYALITGGTAGIGKAIAEDLAKRGENLILAARGEQELKLVQMNLQSKYGIEVLVIQTDLSEETGIEKLIVATQNLEIGLLVLAAGIEVNGAFEKNSLENELQVIQLNIVAMLKLTHNYVPKMIARKKGGLLLVASLSGHMPNPYFANYAGSKAYTLNFGASLYGELKPKGVDVVVLSPGLTKTNMVANNGVDWSKTPLKQMDPKLVAATGIKALGNKLIAIPGAKNKIMAVIAKHSPFKLQAVMNEKMMQKAIETSKI